MAYISLPGTSGNYASTADVNLLDADTAHLYQSVGKWTRYFSVNNTHVDDASFFSGKGQKILATGVSAASVRTNASSRISVSASTEYEFQVRLKAETACRVALIIAGYTAANSFIGNITIGSDIDLTAGQDYVYRISGTTQATAALLDVNIQLYESGGAQALSGTGFTMGDCQLATTLALDFVPSLRIVGDLDIEAKLALDDWTPGSEEFALGNRQVNLGYSWSFAGPGLYYRHGYSTSNRGHYAYDCSGLTNGETYVIRVYSDISAGTSNVEVDGVAVNDSSGFATDAAVPSGAAFHVGHNPSAAGYAAGDIYYVIVRDGIDGPIVAKYDAEEMVNHASLQVTDTDTWVGDNDSRTWTLNGSGSTSYYPELLGGGSDAVMSHLSNLDSPPASLGIVGALTEKAGLSADTDYRFALLSYLNIDT